MRHDRMSTSRPPGRLARVRDEAEPPAPSIAREDDRYRTRRADGDEAEVDVEAEGGRPQERGDATVDARWPQVGHRRILGQALPVDLDDLGRLDRHPLVVGAAPGVLHGLRREPGALPGSLVELAHPRPQAREDEAAERDDCSENPVAGGERERADGQRYEAETERRERRHDPEQARLDSVERQGARFGGGYRMATARAEACSDRERVGAAGARLLHGCAVPGPAQSESGGGALRGSCQALREPSGSLRRPSPWSASRTDAASDHSFAEPVTLSSTAPADLSPWPCGLLVRPSGSVSTYSRPVLGASGTLGRCKWVFKTSGEAESAICEVFNFPHFHSRSCSLWKKPEKRLRARSTRSRVRSAPRARRT